MRGRMPNGAAAAAAAARLRPPTGLCCALALLSRVFGRPPRHPQWRGFTATAAQSQPRQLSRLIGQPHSATHPHLLPAGEVTAGTTLVEYRERRERLLAMMPEGSVCVLQAAPTKIMSHDIPYRFRQNCDFLYLTGCQEPSAVAVFSHQAGLVLFVADRDPKKELWDGPMTGVDGAEFLGADAAFSLRDVRHQLPDLLKGAEGIVYRGGDRSSTHEGAVTAGINAAHPHGVQDADAAIQGMRLVKSSSERALLREAARIGAGAFRVAMREAREGQTEWSIDALLEYEMRRSGAARLGYPPVVAGGHNATILHYINNDMPLRRGELLLVDAGADFCHYNSDITRTWPISAPFSSSQREIYELVLEVQQRCIAECVEGTSLSALGYTAERQIEEGLERMGKVEPHHRAHIVRQPQQKHVG